jgi:hypothetical protein
MKHGDHVFRAVAVNLAHQRRSAGGHAKGQFNELPLIVFSCPVPFHCLQHVERFVRVRLGHNQAGREGDEHGGGDGGHFAN